MNPVDSLELQAFCRKLNEEMPALTESTAKVKWSYVRGMPKNFMEDCAVPVDNKFLNDNLSIVEEIAHRDPSHPIPKWFRDYQIKHFAKFGILNTDRFFTTRMRDGYRKHLNPNFSEIREIGLYPYVNMIGFCSAGSSKVFGTELSSGADETTNGHAAVGELHCSKANTLGTVGTWYDQIAISIVSSAGNMRLGAYSDNSGPNSLLVDSGSLAAPGASTYTYRSVPEYQITTAQIWLAYENDNTSLSFRTASNSITNGRKLKSLGSYQALPSPYGSGGALDNYPLRMKTNHS